MKNTVKELRLAKNWSQQQLADQVNVSRQMISYIEKGEKKPNIILALKLAEVFAVPIKKIFLLEQND